MHFEPGINLIVGSSDVGKSALLRAINLAMHNEVPNREFVTYGAKNATVCLEFSDGTVIERVKGDEKNSKNSYYLTLPNGENLEFDRVGTDVPEEVQRALGFPPSDKYHGPLAYADQHSKLFLVSLTPTELPRAISQLTGLDDFEDGAKELAKQARQFDRKIKDSVERLARIEEDLSQYDGLDAQLRRLERYEEEMERLETLDQSLAEAQTLLQQYEDVMREGRQAKKLLDAAKPVAAAAEQLEDLQQALDSLDKAEETSRRYAEVLREESAARRAMQAAQAVASDDDAQLLESIAKSLDEIEEMNEHLAEYAAVMSEGQAAKKSKTDAEVALKQAQLDEENFRKELVAKGAMCGECGQVMDV